MENPPLDAGRRASGQPGVIAQANRAEVAIQARPAGPLAADEHAVPAVRQAPGDLSGQELAEVRLVERVLPTVVSIRAVTTSFEQGRSTREGSMGTGVLIGPSCHVLTAAHVVDGAQTLSVRFHDGVERSAQLLFSEPGADIALLQLVPPMDTLAFAELGDSDRLAVGQRAYVIGNPRGLLETFTAGHISAFREFNRLYDGSILVEFLQTDAAINAGNSGGPVFDSGGRLIGITSRISSRSGGSEGLGFAITINAAKQLLALESRGWTGFEAAFLGADQLATLFQLDHQGALLVQHVTPGSPADRAGLIGGTVPATIGGQALLLGGDLILEVGQQQACHGACLAAAHDRLARDTELPVRFLRGGREQHTVVETTSVHRNYLTR